MKTLIIVMLMVSVACAGEVWLKWKPTDDINVLQYGKVVAKITNYSSTGWRTHDIVLGNRTSMIMSNISSGRKRIHLVYSTTTIGVSPPSNIVRVDMPPAAPKSLKVLVIQTTPITIKEEP